MPRKQVQLGLEEEAVPLDGEALEKLQGHLEDWSESWVAALVFRQAAKAVKDAIPLDDQEHIYRIGEHLISIKNRKEREVVAATIPSGQSVRISRKG